MGEAAADRNNRDTTAALWLLRQLSGREKRAFYEFLLADLKLAKLLPFGALPDAISGRDIQSELITRVKKMSEGPLEWPKLQATEALFIQIGPKDLIKD